MPCVAAARRFDLAHATPSNETGELRAPATDDNPDIEDYPDNFELPGVYKAAHPTFTAMRRLNLDLDTPRGALQLDWSFPLHGQLRGYLQFFNGCGESLIDYDHNVTSLGLGVRLTDWL